MRFLHSGVIVAISMALVATGSPLLAPVQQDLATASSALVATPSSSSLGVSPYASMNIKSHKKKNKKNKKKRGSRKPDCHSYDDTPNDGDNGEDNDSSGGDDDKDDHDDGEVGHGHDNDHDKDDYNHGKDDDYDNDNDDDDDDDDDDDNDDDDDDDDDDYDDGDDDYDDYDDDHGCYRIPDSKPSESAPSVPGPTEPPQPSDGDRNGGGDSDEHPVEPPTPSDSDRNGGGDNDEQPVEPPTPSDGGNDSGEQPTHTGGGEAPSFPSPTEDPSSSHDILPVSSPYYLPYFGVPDFTPKKETPRGPIERGTVSFDLQDYPDTWTNPSGDHPEVQAAVAAIDWNYVPNAPIRTAHGIGDLDMKDYDVKEDEHCWWSATGCFKPKVEYIPEDTHICSEPGDWGLVSLLVVFLFVLFFNIDRGVFSLLKKVLNDVTVCFFVIWNIRHLMMAH